MNIENRKLHFIERGTEMHNGKFDYSLIEYKNAKTEVKIICSTHGEFFIKPDKHLAKNSKGCQKCWEEIRLENAKRKKGQPPVCKREIITKEEFLRRCLEKYGNKYKYELREYNGLTKNKITIQCPLHGDFLALPNAHLFHGNSSGCKQCGKLKAAESMTLNYNDVIMQFNEKFCYEYDYPDYNEKIYINKKSVIDIVCRKHGLFKKKAQKHLRGQGCFKCKIDELIRNNILVGGYSEELFQKKPELKLVPGFLYYLNINDGEYYKIGISKVSVKNRVGSLTRNAKSFNEIISIKVLESTEKTLYECFLIEQETLNKFDYCRVFKSWSTELFSKDIFPEIKDFFYLNTDVNG